MRSMNSRKQTSSEEETLFCENQELFTASLWVQSIIRNHIIIEYLNLWKKLRCLNPNKMKDFNVVNGSFHGTLVDFSLWSCFQGWMDHSDKNSIDNISIWEFLVEAFLQNGMNIVSWTIFRTWLNADALISSFCIQTRY